MERVTAIEKNDQLFFIAEPNMNRETMTRSEVITEVTIKSIF
jgi:hypothetical protein